MARRVVIPPNTVQTVSGEAERDMEGDVILQPSNQHEHLLMPCSLGKVTNKVVPVQVCNPTNKYVTLKKGYHVGYLEEIDEILEGEPSMENDLPVDEQSAETNEGSFI